MFLLNSPLILQKAKANLGTDINKKTNHSISILETFESSNVISNNTNQYSLSPLKGVLFFNNTIFFKTHIDKNNISAHNYIFIPLSLIHNYKTEKKISEKSVDTIETRKTPVFLLNTTLRDLNEKDNWSEKLKVSGTALKWENVNINNFIKEENLKQFNKNSFVLQFLNILPELKDHFKFNSIKLNSTMVTQYFNINKESTKGHLPEKELNQFVYVTDSVNENIFKTTSWLSNVLQTAILTVLKETNLIGGVDNSIKDETKSITNERNERISNSSNYVFEMKKSFHTHWSTSIKNTNLMVFKAGYNKVQLTFSKDILISSNGNVFEINTKRPKKFLSKVTHSITNMYKRDPYHGKGIWRVGENMKLKARKKKT